MSQLDDILDTIDLDPYYGEIVEGREEAKQQIKALILELIGEDHTLEGDTYGIHEAQNDLKYELRQKVQNL
jgi:hypothetical protein